MTDEEFYNNLFIKDVAAQMVETPDEENFMHVVAELIIRINDGGTVPAALMNELHIVWGFDPDIETSEVFADDEKIGKRSTVIVSDDGRHWIPLFTTRDEIQDVPDTNEIIDIPIKTLLEMACEEDDIDGVIINPYSESLALHKEVLELILDNADGSVRHAC